MISLLVTHPNSVVICISVRDAQYEKAAKGGKLEAGAHLKQALAVQVGELELHNELGKVLAVDDELLVELDHSQSHLEDKCAVVALTE